MAGLVPIYLNNVPNTPDGLRELAELPNSRTAVLVNAPVRQTIFNSSMSTAKIFTTTNRDLMADPDWWTFVTSDPGE